MKQSIKTKITTLTISMIILTLGISLISSYQNAVKEKKNHAEKLMVNIAKQIGLLKSLKHSVPNASFKEYAKKTVYASLSRKGFTIHMVYLLSTNNSGELDTYIFNENLFANRIKDKFKFAQSLLLAQSPVHEDALLFDPGDKESSQEQSLQNTRIVNIQLSEKEHIQIGFSLHILKSDILFELYYHILLGLLIIIIGVVISLFLSHMMTAPLLKLMNGLQKVREGNLDIRVHVHSGDEIQLLTESFNQMADGLKEREMIKDVFSRYASDQVVQRILQGEVKPVLEGSLKNVTVLFADIRKFTHITNSLAPQQVVQILNLHFSAMNDIVNKYEGLVDKYTGDEIMAVFGAPLSHSDDPLRAVKTSIDMIGALEEVNKKLLKLDLPTISIGIGMHSGTAIAGNIGSEKRLNYTVIGKDVNIAARIVNLAKENEIYISEACYLQVKNHIQVTGPEQVSLKGMQETFQVYRVVL